MPAGGGAPIWVVGVGLEPKQYCSLSQSGFPVHYWHATPVLYNPLQPLEMRTCFLFVVQDPNKRGGGVDPAAASDAAHAAHVGRAHGRRQVGKRLTLPCLLVGSVFG